MAIAVDTTVAAAMLQHYPKILAALMVSLALAVPTLLYRASHPRHAAPPLRRVAPASPHAHPAAVSLTPPRVSRPFRAAQVFERVFVLDGDARGSEPDAPRRRRR